MKYRLLGLLHCSQRLCRSRESYFDWLRDSKLFGQSNQMYSFLYDCQHSGQPCDSQLLGQLLDDLIHDI
jgi:hypothetical protein